MGAILGPDIIGGIDCIGAPTGIGIDWTGIDVTSGIGAYVAGGADMEVAYWTGGCLGGAGTLPYAGAERMSFSSNLIIFFSSLAPPVGSGNKWDFKAFEYFSNSG